MYNLHKLYVLVGWRSWMHTTSQNILKAFNQLPEIEKHAIASEIIKQIVLLDIPPLTDHVLTEIADALFVEHDITEAKDAEGNSRESLVKGLYP